MGCDIVISIPSGIGMVPGGNSCGAGNTGSGLEDGTCGTSVGDGPGLTKKERGGLGRTT